MSSKYPQGYIPKIEYWQYKVNKAIQEQDWAGVEYSIKKLSHFVSRQYVKENQVIVPMDQSPSAVREYKLSSKGLTRVR